MPRKSTKFAATSVASREDFEFFVEDHRYGDTDRYDWRGIRRKANTCLSAEAKREAMSLRAKINEAIEVCLELYGNMVSPELLEVTKAVRERVDQLGELTRALVQDRLSYIQSCFNFSWIRELNRARRGEPSSEVDRKQVSRRSNAKIRSYAEEASESLDNFWLENVDWTILNAWAALRNSRAAEEPLCSRHEYIPLSSGDKLKHPAYQDFRKVFYNGIPVGTEKSSFYLFLTVVVPNKNHALFSKPSGWAAYSRRFHTLTNARIMTSEEMNFQIESRATNLNVINSIERAYGNYISELVTNSNQWQSDSHQMSNYALVNHQLMALFTAVKMYVTGGKQGGMDSLVYLQEQWNKQPQPPSPFLI